MHVYLCVCVCVLADSALMFWALSGYGRRSQNQDCRNVAVCPLELIQGQGRTLKHKNYKLQYYNTIPGPTENTSSLILLSQQSPYSGVRSQKP